MDYSPLGRLSAELRNKISQLVLVHDRTIVLADAPQANSLTKTCRQMRCETSAMFWGTNDFSYQLSSRGNNEHLDSSVNNDSYAHQGRHIVRFLHALGSETLTCIQYLSIRSEGYEMRIYGVEIGKAKLEMARSFHWLGSRFRELEMGRFEQSRFRVALQALVDLGLNVRFNCNYTFDCVVVKD